MKIATNKFNIGDLATVLDPRESRSDNECTLKDYEAVQGGEVRISLIKSIGGQPRYSAFTSSVMFYEDELKLCKSNDDFEKSLELLSGFRLR